MILDQLSGIGFLIVRCLISSICSGCIQMRNDTIPGLNSQTISTQFKSNSHKPFSSYFFGAQTKRFAQRFSRVVFLLIPSNSCGKKSLCSILKQLATHKNEIYANIIRIWTIRCGFGRWIPYINRRKPTTIQSKYGNKTERERVERKKSELLNRFPPKYYECR